ncbi:hypothetical protein [Spirosoma arcticum]
MTLPLPADKRMMSFERLMGVVITFYRANPKNSPNKWTSAAMRLPFKVIHLNDLITEKLATGRSKDLGDVEELIKLKNDRNTD